MKNPFEKFNLSKGAKIAAIGLGLTATAANSEAHTTEMTDGKANEIVMEKGDISWAEQALANAKTDAQSIKTAEDAEWFLKNCRKIFQDHLGMLAVDAEGNANYSREDYMNLLACAQQMQSVMNGVVSKFGSADASLSKINLDYITQYLQKKSSVSGYQQSQMLEGN